MNVICSVVPFLTLALIFILELLLLVKVIVEPLIEYFPFTDLPLTVEVKVPSALNTMVNLPLLIPTFARYVLIFSSSLEAATAPPTLVTAPSDSNETAGCVYFHVPAISFAVTFDVPIKTSAAEESADEF